MQSLRQLSCASNKKQHSHRHQSSNSSSRTSRDESSNKKSKQHPPKVSVNNSNNSAAATAVISPSNTATTPSSSVVSTTAASSSQLATTAKSEVLPDNKIEGQHVQNDEPSFASSDDTNVVVGIVDSKTGVVTAIGSHHHRHRQFRTVGSERERSVSAIPHHQHENRADEGHTAASTVVAAPVASFTALHLADNNGSGRSSSVPRNQTSKQQLDSANLPVHQQFTTTGCFSDSETAAHPYSFHATSSSQYQQHPAVSTNSIPTTLHSHHNKSHGLLNGDVKRPFTVATTAEAGQKESVQNILDQLFRTHTANQQQQQALPETNKPFPPHNNKAPVSLSPVRTTTTTTNLGSCSTSQLDELDIVHNILNIPALRSLLKLHDALSSDESSSNTNLANNNNSKQVSQQQRQQQVHAALLPPPPPPPQRTKSPLTQSATLRSSSSATHIAEEQQTLPESDFWLDTQNGHPGQTFVQSLATVNPPLQNDALNLANDLCEQVRRQNSVARRRKSSFDLDAVESDDVDMDQPPAVVHSASTLYVRTVPSLHAIDATLDDTTSAPRQQQTVKLPTTRNSLLADMKYMTAHASTDTADTVSSSNTHETTSTMTDDVMQALGEEDEEQHAAEKLMVKAFSSTESNQNSAAPNAESLLSSVSGDITLQLQSLLQSEHFRALLQAHDTIARRDYGPAALEHNSCMMRPIFDKRSAEGTSPLPLSPPPPPPPSTLTTFVANKITTFPSAAPYATTIGAPSCSTSVSSSTSFSTRNVPPFRNVDPIRVSCSNEEIKTPFLASSSSTAVGPSPLLPPPPPPVRQRQQHNNTHQRSGSAGRPLTADNSERANGVHLLTRSATVTSATTGSCNVETQQRRQHQSVHWQNDEPTMYSPLKQQRTETSVDVQQRHVPTDISYDAGSSSTATTASGTLTTNTDDEDDNTVAMRCVRLVRTNEPLGATIRRDERTGSIMIARVFPGGAAQRSGLMRPGDVLLEVNNMPVSGLDPRQVVHLIAQCKGTISFRLIPSATSATTPQNSAVPPYSHSVHQPQTAHLPSARFSGQIPSHQQHTNYVNVLPHPSVAHRARLIAQQQPHQQLYRQQHSQPLFREVVMQQQRHPTRVNNQPLQPVPISYGSSEYFTDQYQQQPVASTNSNPSLVRLQQMPTHTLHHHHHPNAWPHQQQRSARSVEFLPPPRVAVAATAAMPVRPRRFMRAHFDFDPELDSLVPNRDEGLPFKRGDILEIVDDYADDVNWWRARLIQTSHSCTNIGSTTATSSTGGGERQDGYVPAKQLQERRMLAQRRQQILNGTHYYCKIHGYSTWPHGRRPERRAAQQQQQTEAATAAADPTATVGGAVPTTFHQSVHSDELDRADIITYESVSLLQPGSVGGYGFNVRPIVIIGPPGVGKNELRARLIQMNSERFQTTIPHTSRAMRQNEREGDEYHFVTRVDMEQRIKQGNFLEWGEYEGNLYGTSLDEVSKCMRRGTVCVLVIHPSAVRRIRTAEYMPFIIYVQPPSLERLRETRMAARARSTFDERLLRGFTEHEFRYILSYAERMESQYSHVFDAVIVNDNLALAFAQLKSLVFALDREPQWVPTVWLSQRDDIVGNHNSSSTFVRHQHQPSAFAGSGAATTAAAVTAAVQRQPKAQQHHHSCQQPAAVGTAKVAMQQ